MNAKNPSSVSPSSPIPDSALHEQIRRLAPWHHDIQLTSSLSTGRVFSESGTLPPGDNQGVSLISPRTTFLRQVDRIFPNGLTGKRFLDCACNGGGYCFWARERDVAWATGFDVRQHWIDQAEFVRQQRTIHPTDRIEFFPMDLYELPSRQLEPYDLTYFSGLFYHLPDPITGLKIAADLTEDVMIFNTSMMAADDLPPGLSLSMEGTAPVMSGVHELAWLPNSPETLEAIFRWLGFASFQVLKIQTNPTSGRRRIHLLAGRDPDRFPIAPSPEEAE